MTTYTTLNTENTVVLYTDNNPKEIISAILITDEQERSCFMKEYFGEYLYIEGEKLIYEMISGYFEFHSNNKNEIKWKFYKLLESGIHRGFYIALDVDCNNFEFKYAENNSNKAFSADAASIAANLRILDYLTFAKQALHLNYFYKILLGFALQHAECDMIIEVISQ